MRKTFVVCDNFRRTICAQTHARMHGYTIPVRSAPRHTANTRTQDTHLLFTCCQYAVTMLFVLAAVRISRRL